MAIDEWVTSHREPLSGRGVDASATTATRGLCEPLRERGFSLGNRRPDIVEGWRGRAREKVLHGAAEDGGDAAEGATGNAVPYFPLDREGMAGGETSKSVNVPSGEPGHVAQGT